MYRFVCTQPPHTVHTGEVLWSRGDVVHVKFLDGDWNVWDAIAEIVSSATGWNAASSIHFAFEQKDDAEIRISFNSAGTWSHVGKQCLSVPPDLPTMNFQGMFQIQSEFLMHRAVNHTFGHAMGFGHPCKHMQQTPWHDAKIYGYYAEAFGWDKERVDREIVGNLVAGCGCVHDNDDIMSVMNYRMDPRLTRNMTYNGLVCNGLSRYDRQRAIETYGPPAFDWHKTYYPSLWADMTEAFA